MKDLSDVLEALTLIFADDVKMATPQTKSINLHSLWGELITTFNIFAGLLDIHPNLVFLPPTRRVVRGIPTTFYTGFGDPLHRHLTSMHISGSTGNYISAYINIPLNLLMI